MELDEGMHFTSQICHCYTIVVKINAQSRKFNRLRTATRLRPRLKVTLYTQVWCPFITHKLSSSAEMFKAVSSPWGAIVLAKQASPNHTSNETPDGPMDDDFPNKNNGSRTHGGHIWNESKDTKSLVAEGTLEQVIGGHSGAGHKFYGSTTNDCLVARGHVSQEVLDSFLQSRERTQSNRGQNNENQSHGGENHGGKR